jgi:hypothetical protein
MQTRPIQATALLSDSVLVWFGADMPAEDAAEKCATSRFARLMRPHSITFTAKSNSHLSEGLALQLDRQSKNDSKLYIPAGFASSRKD